MLIQLHEYVIIRYRYNYLLVPLIGDFLHLYHILADGILPAQEFLTHCLP